VSYKPHFSRFLGADPERLHFAAHSHHPWPDVTYEAQRQCWLDAARLADRKWDKVFGEIIPTAQRHVARRLGLPDPRTLAFGPNTHGFLLRLLSLLPDRRSHILGTDSEFHSFARQARRLAEDRAAAIDWIPVEPFEGFAERFAAAARGGPELIYFSQVFYNSGFAVADLARLVGAVGNPDSIVVVDGYHGFMALPTDLSGLADRIFYLAGGYKYAMAGEGAVFLHCPPGYGARPRDTGWLAGFGALEAGEGDAVGYGRDGSRFLGATFDPVGLYRMNAVMAWLDELGLTVEAIHARAHALQRRFIERLDSLNLSALHSRQLVVPLEQPSRGNFLAFRAAGAAAIHRALLDTNIVTDCRGDRLRFGFGLYHDEADIDRLCERLARLLR
jgi:selenocysteine lyase/cysteine desulfurase